MTAEPLCEAVRPVCISKADQLTEPTAKLLRQNAVGRAKVCGPAPDCRTVPVPPPAPPPQPVPARTS